MQQHFFSIIIPVKSINDYITQENLPAIANQSYHHFEVIILPNKKSPKDNNLLRIYPWLKIIPTNNVTRPAAKRDLGVTKTKGDFIAFIDDDAYPDNYWLTKANEIINQNNDNIAAVCGPGILPAKTKVWEKIFNLILISKLGSGSYDYRFIAKSSRFVDDYPSMNFIVNKKIFNMIGGFNSEYWPGEDSKLCNDLVYQQNKTILYHPDLVVYHHRRNDLIGFLKQHSNYGFHRGAFFVHGDNNSRKLIYLIPPIFSLYLILLLIIVITNKNALPFIAPIIIYLILLTIFFIQSLLKKGIVISLAATLILFLTHFIYGLFFIKGSIKAVAKKNKIY